MTIFKEIEELGLLVYTANGFREFMRTSMAVFDGHSALEMIALGQYESVIAALAADYEGLGYLDGFLEEVLWIMNGADA